ncbi:MAG: endonuclease/exonuclease/phosphatase family protein [Dyadobacter sp.]|uniref:endonuclease/exonuclease/phosphatase family protein n=1 Tax=Dyadobacter sp. TaxID=1914288 RepID=UPI003267EC33
MRGVKKFLWFLYKCFAFYTLLIYILILWIPSGGWLAGFMMMSFPVVVIIHLISVPIWFLIDRKKALLPLVLLIGSGIFLSRTYRFGSKDASIADESGNTFTVMNYNVHSFQRFSDGPAKQVENQIEDMKNWIATSGADVLCMPEYFDDGSARFNMGELLGKKGIKHSAHYSNSDKNYRLGLALYSRFPIIARKDTIFEAQNGMIQADIKIKKDTVRIIGLHLFSMTLKLSTLVHQKKMDGVAKEGKITFSRIKMGFIRHAAELEVLESWIEDSPYPVVVCGDFNEMPYGYVYGNLRKKLDNGFEKGGKGFGFTFNHLPYFIRIDHQFYSPDRLGLLDFTTYNKIGYSDHYPVMGRYQVTPNQAAH